MKALFDAVLFDFDGTLVDYVDTDIRTLEWLHARLGLSIPFDSFLDTAVEEIMTFHELVDAGAVDPLRLHEYRLKNTFLRHNIAWNDIVIEWYRKKLIALCRPFPGVESILAGIRKKVKTGIVSNAYDGTEQRARIRNAGLETLFDTIVIAGDIGVFKPEPPIFLYSLNRLNVPPHRALYVGDSPVYDIAGAKAAGMQAVLLTRNGNANDGGADHIARGTAELGALFNRLELLSGKNTRLSGK